MGIFGVQNEDGDVTKMGTRVAISLCQGRVRWESMFCIYYVAGLLEYVDPTNMCGTCALRGWLYTPKIGHVISCVWEKENVGS